MHPSVLTIVVLSHLIKLGVARGVDLGLCDDKKFDCPCGSSARYTVTKRVKECTYFYQFKPYCKPCNDVKKEEICVNFLKCQECNQNDLNRCASCPSGRYGNWCEGFCKCQNGGNCDTNGICNCIDGYEGRYCEKSTGCQAPDIAPPLVETRVPLNRPLFIEYQCPSTHHLVGVNRISCLSTREWSHPPPSCNLRCDLPETIPNCKVIVNRRPVLEGDSVKFECLEGYAMFGSSTVTCGGNGQFDNELPTCAKVRECPDPLKVLRSEMVVQYSIPRVSDRYYNGTVIKYQCDEDLFRYGKPEIVCLDNGAWSSPPPACVKVPDVSVNCETSASRVMDDNGVIVRVQCPPGCAMSSDVVYGTVIYHYHSSICRAAIHGGKITNEGGSVYLTNSGHYSDFLGTNLNGVTSEAKTTAGTSFRFTHSPDKDFSKTRVVDESTGDISCPSGWTENNGYCSVYVERAKAWEFARNTCHNMGTRLPNLRDTKFLSIAKSTLDKSKGLKQTWLLSKRNPSNANPVTILEKDGPNDEEKIYSQFSPLLVKSDDLGGNCTVVESRGNDLVWLSYDCQKKSPFFCLIAPAEEVEESCEDPGPVPNGFAKFQGQNQGFQKGSILKYSCDQLYFLSGQNTLVCTQNATWSSPKPRCIKINTCTDPVVPKYGSMQIFPPDNTLSQSKRAGIVRSRVAIPRFPTITTTTTETPELATNSPTTAVADGTVFINETTVSPSKPTIETIINATIVASVSKEFVNETGTTEPSPTTEKVKATQVNVRPLKAGPISESNPSKEPLSPNGLSYKPSKDVVYGSESTDIKIPDNFTIPEGHYRVGSRVVYSCESRYYDIAGSSNRRCQSDGTWSGRGATCVPVCGRSDSPRTPFITNGNATEVGQWPWQVGISSNLNDQGAWFLLCGGALISETWVATAAHCLTDHNGQILAPGNFKFQFGKYHRNNELDDEMVEERMAKEIHIHPDFDPTLYDADIALVLLNIPVILTSRVQPVCLPTDRSTRTNIVDGRKGVVTGWGLNENDEYSETLRQAVMPVVSADNCEKGYENAGLPLSVSENMFCAGYEKGKTDACNGDSGGPMVFLDDTVKGRRWVLEGIVSWGSPTGCGNPQQFGGFTLVNKFLDWIQQFV